MQVSVYASHEGNFAHLQESIERAATQATKPIAAPQRPRTTKLLSEVLSGLFFKPADNTPSPESLSQEEDAFSTVSNVTELPKKITVTADADSTPIYDPNNRDDNMLGGNTLFKQTFTIDAEFPLKNLIHCLKQQSLITKMDNNELEIMSINTAQVRGIKISMREISQMVHMPPAA